MAVSYNGQNQKVQIGKQTIQGTPAATLHTLSCKPVSHSLTMESIKYENSTGSRIGGKDRPAGQTGKASIAAQMEARTVGYLLAAALGTHAKVDLTPIGATHSFTPQANSAPAFYTLLVAKDGKYCAKLIDLVCQSLNIEMAAGAYVEVGTEWQYSDETTAALPAFTAVDPVAIAATIGQITVAGSAPEELATFSLAINNNTKGDLKGLNNGGKPIAILHGNADITGKFSVVLNDNTAHFMTKYKAATEFAIDVAIDTGEEITGTGENFAFGLTASKCVITECTESQDSPMMLDVSFKVCEDGASTLELTLANDQQVEY